MMRRLLAPLAIFGAPLSRRAILAGLARIGLLIPAAPALSAATTEDPVLLALSGLVRKLVPHGALDDVVYVDAAMAIRGAIPVTAKEIADGLRRLEAGTPGELPADAFLARMRTAAVEALYRDPRVWKSIGYGGNALARGGYVASFNKIDWLPGEKK